MGFASDAQRNRSEQASGWRVATEASYRQSFESDARMGLGGRTGKIDWPGSGNNVGQGIYGSPHSSNDTAVNRTASILCAEYNLCIDYDPPAPRFGDWQGNIAPLDGSYLTTKQFGWSYGDVLLANASTSAGASAGDLALMPPNPSFSNAVDRSSGVMSSAATAQSPLTGGKSSIVSAAVTGAVSDFYQTANSRVLAGSISSEDNLGKTDAGLSGGVIVSPRAVPPTSIRRSAASSSSSAGNDSASAGNGDANQGSSSVNVWPVVTFGATSDVPESNPWPLEFHTSDPVYLFPAVIDNPIPAIDPPAPVPEPSQITLMLTVIALVGLIARRTASKYGSAVRQGRA
jgi:hypothetical protein